MSLMGWIQRCRQTQARFRELEAENRQLKERNAWLESQIRADLSLLLLLLILLLLLLASWEIWSFSG